MPILSWYIINLDRTIIDGCVFTAHWAVRADDGELFANSYGSVSLEPPDGEMIPFADLTEEIAIGWVKDRLDALAVETALISQINEQLTPSTANGLPWS